MKKFVYKVLMWAAFCCLITVVFPYTVDPYNVFHVRDIKSNGVEPNKNYIKMKYITSNPDKFNAYLFGSSRVAAIHTEKIKDVNCYNMTYSAGLVAEHIDNVKTLVNSGIDVKRVYIGVDSLCYTDEYRNHNSDPMRMSYEYIKNNQEVFLKTYFDPLMTIRSLPTIIRNKDVMDYESFYANGWGFDYGHECGGSWTENMEPYIGTAENYEDNIAEVLEQLEDMVSYCKKQGIELTIFTNPMQYVTYKASIDRGYLEFLRGLAQITDFYNFSGYNDITLDNMNYYDTSHYSAEIGDLMINVMNGDEVDEALLEQGFGVYTSSENIEDLIKVISTK